MPVIVKVQGPHETTKPDHETHLQTQLQSIPRDITFLRIDQDTPSDTEWALLGSHFSKVENLELESGWNEDLNDKNIPLHWPLRRLELRSASSEVVQSPFVRQGRVSHLSLLYTCGLRFVGPPSNELYRNCQEEVARGERQLESFTFNEGTPEERSISIFSLPELVAEHMNKYYCGPDQRVDPANEPPSGPINLHTLEIFENDAIDTFCRMTMALPHLVENLRTLRISSTQGLDFHYLNEEPFRYILPRLENLQTLDLSLGDVFQDPAYLPTLHKILPPNLTAFCFRGPASMCQSEHWSEWLDAFGSSDFLPKLQSLAFVLDLQNGETNKCGGRPAVKASDELLRQAREKCERLWGVARLRGIRIVDIDPESFSGFAEPVDDRW